MYAGTRDNRARSRTFEDARGILARVFARTPTLQMQPEDAKSGRGDIFVCVTAQLVLQKRK